jgi:hypothetical protein
MAAIGYKLQGDFFKLDDNKVEQSALAKSVEVYKELDKLVSFSLSFSL